MTALIALLSLIACMLIGIPIPLGFFASALIICTLNGTNPIMMISFGFQNMNSILLLSIPLFVLAGALIDKGGIGEKLIYGLLKLFKGSRSSIGTVTVVSCAVFGAVSGSSSATLSCIGSIMTPRLKEAGYAPGHIGALLASSGVLGIMIPPSILMILYAWGTGASVLGCFLSTIIPGIILITLFSLINAYWVKKEFKGVPFIPNDDKADDTIEKTKGRSSTVPAVLMPVLLLGSIYTGVLTATEGAAFTVGYSILVGCLYYKKLKKDEFLRASIDAGKTAGVIMTMLFSIGILSRLFITENLPDLILTFLTGISSNRVVILLMVNLFMVIIGMLMDDCSGTILCGPILLPVVAQFGITPIQFAAILSVNIGMGNVTPPTAPLLYLSARVSGAEVKDMLKKTFILIGFGWLPTLILTTFIPALSTTLPGLLGYV